MIKNFHLAPKYKKYKRLMQIMALTLLSIYITCFFYQNVCGASFSQESKNGSDKIAVVGFGEEANNTLNYSSRIIPIATPEPFLSSYSQQLTNTVSPEPVELDDIFISVKTTKQYHDLRLAIVIKTWFQLAKDQTWFFTDTDDSYYQKLTNNHFINTKCPVGHNRKALCCKMGKEFDYFLNSAKKYFCHFDDDNYVNVPQLVKILKNYSPNLDWYLGKPSISSPIEMYLDSARSLMTTLTNEKPSNDVDSKVKFWFATGGAGFCISRSLALKMMPLVGGGKFENVGDKIRFPDDVTMGFVIEHLIKVPLTKINEFHSHLENMEVIQNFPDQISFSYGRFPSASNQWNLIKIDDGFDLKTDPKRFYSLHCQLFPYFKFCQKLGKRTRIR